MSGTRWNPWRALRERRHIEFELTQLPDAVGGAVYWPLADDLAALIIDERLTRVQRRCALAHELVHDERGGAVPTEGMPAAWNVVRIRDEHSVDEDVALRLVPLEELAEVVERISGLGEGVEPWMVAEVFDVTDDVAARALQLLANHGGG